MVSCLFALPCMCICRTFAYVLFSGLNPALCTCAIQADVHPYALSWLHPESRKIVAAARNTPDLLVFNVETGVEEERIPSYSNVVVLDVSVDGEHVATGHADFLIRVWRTASWTVQRELRGHNCSLNSLDFSPVQDGPLVSTGLKDQCLIIWDYRTGQQLHRMVHSEAIAWANFTSDASHVWFSSGTGSFSSISCLDGSVDRVQRPAIGFGEFEYILTTSLQSMKLVVTNSKEFTTLTVLSLQGNPPSTGWQAHLTPNPKMVGHTESINSIGLSRNSKLFLTSSMDKTLRVWDLQTGAQLLMLVGHTESVNGAVFSLDGRKITSSSTDGTIRIWDIDGLYKIRPDLGRS